MTLLPLTAEHVRDIVGDIASQPPTVSQWTPDQVGREIEMGRGWGLFAESGGLMAYVFLSDCGAGVREILLVGTFEKYRRCGYAERLLQGILGTANAEEVWLEVHSDNLVAQRLYEKVGFSQVGRRAKYFADGGDGILYSRKRSQTTNL